MRRGSMDGQAMVMLCRRPLDPERSLPDLLCAYHLGPDPVRHLGLHYRQHPVVDRPDLAADPGGGPSLCHRGQGIRRPSRTCSLPGLTWQNSHD